MEILELIWENLVEIIIGVFLWKNTKSKNVKKQAKFNEAVESQTIENKRERLKKLRQEDEDYSERIKNNLIEETKLEKELGENA